MHLSDEDLSLIIEALGQYDAEYGSAAALELAERVRAERAARRASV